MNILTEACIENTSRLAEVIAKGAKRIELCDNLAVGGTSVSYGVLKYSIDYTKKHGVTLMTMIRPRGGNFVYNSDEKQIILDDIDMAVKLGVYGIVIGALTMHNWLDEDFIQLMLQHAPNTKVTFHMAFDQIPVTQQLSAIDWLAEHKVNRILTHGGLEGTPIKQNLPHLKRLVEHATGKIILLPGGGITNENRDFICETLGVNEAHGTKIVG